MWQQTFRNDSPSPEEWSGHSPEEVICQLHSVHYILFKGPSSEPDPGGARPRPNSLVTDGQGELLPAVPGAPDPRVLEDLERETRRLATEVSFSGYIIQPKKDLSNTSKLKPQQI